MNERKIKELIEVDGVNATAEALDYFYQWYKTDKGTSKKAATAYLMILGAYYAGVLNDAKFVYEVNKKLKGGK